MTKWASAWRVRDVFSCIIANTKKRGFSTSAQNEKDLRPTEKSFQPIKMAYASFESINSVDTSSGTPIIIMHGLLGSKHNWNSLSKVIHNRTKRKVITVDARNHGDSPHIPEMSYPHMAEDVRQLLIDLNIPRATVVGHSMGGRTMMLLALKYPELVKQLIVADISPVRDSPNLKAMPVYLHALSEVKLKPNQTMSAARKEADKQLAANVQETLLRQFFLTNLVEGENGTFKWKMNLEALTTHFNNIASFPHVDISFNGPTYFIGGSKSDFIKPEDHEKIKRFFPNAVFEYVEGAGHWLHAEKPTEFLEILCKFLKMEK
ncbi:hypothetical protein R5R35_007111 [Gryllus longicercus]|uniref:sn-1-specific diacylglycerol lipase ABHD11 n=1 Tax=Gryllus longicercus TaxID=2509291 RepID=A0AAN9Z831_9ORTH